MIFDRCHRYQTIASDQIRGVERRPSKWTHLSSGSVRNRIECEQKKQTDNAGRERERQHEPEEDAVLDFFVEVLALGIDGQHVLEVGIVGQVGVDPVGEGQLLLHAHRVRRALRRGVRHAAQRLQVLALRHQLFERRRHVLGLQAGAQLQTPTKMSVSARS